MPTVTKRKNKDGSTSFYLRASSGYTLNGIQKRMSQTWTAPSHWKDERIQKELDRQKVLFDEAVKSGASRDGNIKFQVFAEKWLDEYAHKQLKIKTYTEHEKRLPLIYEVIGHIKLKDLRKSHLNSFYANLSETGIRADMKYKSKIDLKALLKKLKMTQVALCQKSGLSEQAIRSAIKNERINKKSALAICEALNLKLSETFCIIQPDKTLSPNTVRTYHRIISSILSKAVKWEYIAYNPAIGAELPKSNSKKPSYLDDEDVRRMIKLLHSEPPKYRVMIILDVLSGLRRGELVALRWSDIDFDSETVTIERAAVYISGLGIIDDTPKNETSSRTIKLSRIIFPMLQEYREEQSTQRIACGDHWKSTDDFVFTSEDGGRIHPDALSKWFKGFIKRHGFNENIHLHSLRHTAASIMIADGINIVAVSKRLGHKQVSTTSNIYAHLIKAADEKAAQVADKYAEELGIAPAEIIELKRA